MARYCNLVGFGRETTERDHELPTRKGCRLDRTKTIGARLAPRQQVLLRPNCAFVVAPTGAHYTGFARLAQVPTLAAKMNGVSLLRAGSGLF